MSSNSLYSEKFLSGIKKTHNIFLWAATGIMIASLILGIVLIFVDTQNAMFAKIQGTFFMLALAAFICVNNFIRIEKGNKIVQGFASVGFVANIIWLVLGILMIWEVVSPIEIVTSTTKTETLTTRTYDLYDEYDYDDYDYDEYSSSMTDEEAYRILESLDDSSATTSTYDSSTYGNSTYSNNTYGNNTYTSSYTPVTYGISIMTKIMVVSACIASIGFWVSNILVIKDRIKAIKPLKITAIICQVYCSAFIMVLIFAWPVSLNKDMIKWVELYGLATSGFVIAALAAWIISRTHKNVELAAVSEEPKADKPVAKDEVIEKAVTEEIKTTEVVQEPAATPKAATVQESATVQEAQKVQEPVTAQETQIADSNIVTGQ